MQRTPREVPPRAPTAVERQRRPAGPVVSGESNTIINGATATLPFVTSGQLVGLAVTGKARLKNVMPLFLR